MYVANSIASGMRIFIWLVAAFWCILPVLWFFFMLVSTRGQAAPPPPPAFGGPRPDIVPGLAILGSAFMLTAFIYAIWCAAGIIVVAGIDRAITVVETTAVLVLQRYAQKDSGKQV